MSRLRPTPLVVLVVATALNLSCDAQVGTRPGSPIQVELLSPEADGTQRQPVGAPLEVEFQADTDGFYRLILDGPAGQLVLARGEVEKDQPQTATVSCLELAAGRSQLRIEVGDGRRPGGSAEATLERTGPSPALVDVSPLKGQGGDLITLRGAGFATDADSVPFVRIDGVQATDVTVVSSCEVRARVPARDRLGPVDVSIDFRDGEEPLVLVGGFRYVGAEPLTLDQVVPAVGSLAGGYEVELQGQGFEEGITVTFDGQPAEVVGPPQPTLMRVLVPAGAAGPVTVTLTTPDEEVSRDDLFAYVDVAIDEVTPDEVPYDIATAVQVTGRNLGSTTTIRFGSNPAVTVSGASDTGFSAVTNAPSLDVGPVPVTISTTEFGDVVVANALTFRGPLPVVLDVQPSIGATAGGDRVVVTGTGFFANSQVLFGGQPAQLQTSASGRLEVLTPPGPSGPADLVVRNGDGQSSAPRTFTYVAVPVVVDICPDHVVPGGSFEVSGTDFDPDATLAIDGVDLAATQELPGVLVAAVSADFSGPSEVTVTNPGTGRSGTLAGGLRGNELVEVTVVRFQRQGNRYNYTVSGQGFEPGVQVRLENGTVATPDTVSATELTGSVPRSAGDASSSLRVCYPPQSCQTFEAPELCSAEASLP